MHILAIHAHGDIPAYTDIYMLYIHIHAILIHTYTYMPYRLITASNTCTCMHALHVYTCTYMHMHAHACTYMQLPNTPNLKWPYLWNQLAAWDEPKNNFKNRQWPTGCADLWYSDFSPLICYDMTADQNWSRGSSLVHQSTENMHLISAHAGASCTMRVGGRLAQVSACLNDPGRFYGRGQTDQNTNSFKGVIFDAPKN